MNGACIVIAAATATEVGKCNGLEWHQRCHQEQPIAQSLAEGLQVGAACKWGQHARWVKARCAEVKGARARAPGATTPAKSGLQCEKSRDGDSPV